MQPEVVADVLHPTETIKTSAAGFDTSTPFVRAPALVGGDRGPQTVRFLGVAAVVWVVVLVFLVVLAYVAVGHGCEQNISKISKISIIDELTTQRTNTYTPEIPTYQYTH